MEYWKQPFWKPEGEGDGGGNGGGDDSGGGGDGTPGGNDQGGADAPSGDQGGGDQRDGGSILDFANDGKGASDDGDGNDGEWKLPDDLKIPDHLVGTDAVDTIRKLSTAYKGARQKIGEGGLEGNVPDEIDGYVIEAEGDDDKIAASLNSEDSKPLVDAFRTAAKEVGIPDKAFAALMRQGMSLAAEAGFDVVDNDTAQQINQEAELEALVDTHGKAEAQTIINTVSTWGGKLAERNILRDDADVAEFKIMAGTARSADILYRIMVGELGEQPIPAGDGVEGQPDRGEALAAYAAAKALPDGAERDQALRNATALVERAHPGQRTAGSIRSTVL